MQNLHDIVLTEPVAWVPQTTAWYLLFAIALIAALAGAVVLRRHRRQNRYRKLALARLRDISERGAYAELPVLVKQTALAAYRRTEIASLSGDAWLRFLDASLGGSAFTEGPGRILPSLAYAPRAGGDVDLLVELIRRWIRKHDVRV